VRLPEFLRREIETTAAKRGHSMNTEIVERLLVIDSARNPNELIASALLDSLSDQIIDHIVAAVRRRQLEKKRWEAERGKE
jgi:hypothetical protein